jgi:hypothetical protein
MYGKNEKNKNDKVYFYAGLAQLEITLFYVISRIFPFTFISVVLTLLAE